MLSAAVAVLAVTHTSPALPNARQLDFMELEISQFMHFGVDTAWEPNDAFLEEANPTYHNCNPRYTGTSHDYQTGGIYPCLNASIFNPKELDTEQWMAASASLGVKEICLTAKHAGGFSMWPSKYTPYGVHAAKELWASGKGDIVKRFVASAKRWGIKICYYLNPMTDGYLVQIANATKDEYIAAQHGMLTEILTPGSPWGPVNRFWFDGILGGSGTNYFQPEGLRTFAEYHQYYDDTFALIRKLSPDTLISAQRGDICQSTGSLYTSDGPTPNGTDSSMCETWNWTETGKYFHPNEMHGVTMQEGPDGNTPIAPTYWFWHPKRVCPTNVSKADCPWLGHANASRVFDGYIAVVGHGGNLNMNIAPAANGLMNASVVAVMAEAGKAINDTFRVNDAGKLVDLPPSSCIDGAAMIAHVHGRFDYIVTMEDLRKGQRVANYSIEYTTDSATWKLLVPPIYANASNVSSSLHDRPDGHDPRDQYVGRKRIDVPMKGLAAKDAQAGRITKVRFNCLRLSRAVDANDAVIHLRQFSLHKKIVPWET